ncbi:MAG TPA: hypothetical protein VKN76_00980 [Kiloniellaceae bacterium]|nr:hypothetical protein [Kiloniellaceae bacterium]
MTVLKQWLATLLAVLCIVAGLVTFPTPIPSGVPLVGLGLVVFVTQVRVAPIWLRRLRRRSLYLDGLLVRLEAAAPYDWGRILKRTRPRGRGLADSDRLGF